MAHLLPRKAGARRAHDRDVIGPLNTRDASDTTVLLRHATRRYISRHSVPAGSLLLHSYVRQGGTPLLDKNTSIAVTLRRMPSNHDWTIHTHCMSLR